MSTFAAIDFETANYNRDSACAVGIVIVSEGQIVKRLHNLIKPPSSYFTFTHIHGLTWYDVCNAPTFAELWRDINKHLFNVDYLAAHNAPFDRGVMEACCTSYGLKMTPLPFHCTVQIARSRWGIYPTTLPDVCRHLKINLRHHEALSDAEACANIVIAALKKGWKP
jgi:DNA polymerase-3 subunit epsilon